MAQIFLSVLSKFVSDYNKTRFLFWVSRKQKSYKTLNLHFIWPTNQVPVQKNTELWQTCLMWISVWPLLVLTSYIHHACTQPYILPSGKHTHVAWEDCVYSDARCVTDRPWISYAQIHSEDTIEWTNIMSSDSDWSAARGVMHSSGHL